MKAGALPQDDFPVAERIAYLIASYLKGTLTEAEHDELDAWIVASDDNLRLFEQLTDEAYLENSINWQMQLHEKEAWERVRTKTGLAQQKPLLKNIWPWLIVAGSAAANLLWLALRPAGPDTVQPGNPTASQGQRREHSTAVLTLGDGRTVVLQPTDSGVVAVEGSRQVRSEAGGMLKYEGSGGTNAVHQLAIPRGSSYQVILSDGTKVWLNAASTLWYPVQFGGGKREVRISGEGYFEVAKRTAQPFIVHIEQGLNKVGAVEVLGTKFNVQAYPEKAGAYTTLAEGRVLLRTTEDSTLLEAGEYGYLHGTIKTGRADLEAATGWKNGLFVFRNTPIEAIGKEIERWYDMEVVYKGKINYLFTATIDRKEPLPEFIKVLTATQRVRISQEGKRLTIQP
jgi:transmembrane sensor